MKSLWRALTAVVVLASVLITGVVVSSALEPTGSSATAEAEVIPSVKCVDVLDTINIVHFQYENTTGSVVNISGGLDNFFRGGSGPLIPSSLESFEVGAGIHAADFFTQNSAEWTVIDTNGHSNTATGSVESPPCEVETTTTTVAPTTTSTTEVPTTTTVPQTTTTCEPYVCKS